MDLAVAIVDAGPEVLAQALIDLDDETAWGFLLIYYLGVEPEVRYPDA